jgi:hypothetical protein
MTKKLALLDILTVVVIGAVDREHFLYQGSNNSTLVFVL